MQPPENNSPELSLPKPISDALEPHGAKIQESTKTESPIENSPSRENILNELNSKVAGITNSIPSSNDNQSSSDDAGGSNSNSGVNLPANDNPLVANDDDLIEKEWVEKAKQIVDKTKEDPKEQSTELSYMKSDYMKKRYNRDIKIGN